VCRPFKGFTVSQSHSLPRGGTFRVRTGPIPDRLDRRLSARSPIEIVLRRLVIFCKPIFEGWGFGAEGIGVGEQVVISGLAVIRE
jgi:hypothetical protein